MSSKTTSVAAKRNLDSTGALAAGSKKKAKTVPSDTTNSSKTPHDLYFDRRTEWLNENKNIDESLLIRGISTPEDSDYEEDSDNEEADSTKYTTEQMESLRFVMLTKNRQTQLEVMGKLVLGHQYGDSMMMFDTSFSYVVLDSWMRSLKNRLAKMSPAKKFDALLAYTHTLKEYDVWMHDNEGDMDKLVKGLATVWRNLLKKTDREIGWDSEYTKPGTLEMLRQFKGQVEGCHGLGKFNYQ